MSDCTSILVYAHLIKDDPDNPVACDVFVRNIALIHGFIQVSVHLPDELLEKDLKGDLKLELRVGAAVFLSGTRECGELIIPVFATDLALRIDPDCVLEEPNGSERLRALVDEIVRLKETVELPEISGYVEEARQELDRAVEVYEQQQQQQQQQQQNAHGPCPEVRITIKSGSTRTVSKITPAITFGGGGGSKYIDLERWSVSSEHEVELDGNSSSGVGLSAEYRLSTDGVWHVIGDGDINLLALFPNGDSRTKRVRKQPPLELNVTKLKATRANPRDRVKSVRLHIHESQSTRPLFEAARRSKEALSRQGAARRPVVLAEMQRDKLRDRVQTFTVYRESILYEIERFKALLITTDDSEDA